jgi:hypothetical protein
LRRVFDQNISFDQPQSNAIVEGIPQIDGKIMYLLVDNSGIIPDWLKVNSAEKYGPPNTVVQVLALSLLWTFLDSNVARVPSELCNRIQFAYGLMQMG